VRWLLPLLVTVVLVGCGGTTKSAFVGRAVHAPLCYQGRPTPKPCRSPDGRWTVRFKAGIPGRLPGRLVVTQLATGEQTVDYSSLEECCDDITWARPHTLVFADDYRTFVLDPTKGKATFLAGFTDFYVSPDGRWVAGYAEAPSSQPQPAGLVSLATGKCVLIPGYQDTIGSSFRQPAPTDRGFSRNGEYVVVVEQYGDSFQYPISTLGPACPSWMTTDPDAPRATS
jgi:hypothetical protein